MPRHVAIFPTATAPVQKVKSEKISRRGCKKETHVKLFLQLAWQRVITDGRAIHDSLFHRIELCLYMVRT